MPISQTFNEALNAEYPEVVFAWLVRINTTPPVLLTSNNEPLTVGADTYTPVPSLRPSLPDETESRTPRVALVIDDVGQTIAALIRSTPTTGELTLDLMLIDAQDPSVVQVEFRNLQIVAVEGDAASVRLELSTERLLANAAPAKSFVPSLFPGLFGGS